MSTYISFTFIVGQSLSFMLPNLAGMLEGAAGGPAGSSKMAVGIMSAIACAAMIIPSFYIKERMYIDAEPSQTKPFQSLIKTFSNGQFRRFVYSDVIYFFALTLFQTGLAFYETKLMGISETWTFPLTATMTAITVKRALSGVEAVLPSQYRATAIIATVTCLIGASLFLLYNEKMILSRITALRGEE